MEQVVGYVNLEFMGEIQVGDINLGVLACLKLRKLDEDVIFCFGGVYVFGGEGGGVGEKVYLSKSKVSDKKWYCQLVNQGFIYGVFILGYILSLVLVFLR